VLHRLNGRLETPTSFRDPAPKLWSSICSGGENCAKSEVVAPGIDTLNGVAETSYAPCGDLSLAYQVFGDGPVELVFAGSFVSHVELFWTLPEFQAFMEQLSTFCRVLVFDKAGVGLSDPVPQVRTLDDRAAEIEAVMDAVGFGRAALFGVSEGGPAAMVFAATRPERTRALILTGSYSFFGFTGWDDIERDPAKLRARILPELGAEAAGAHPSRAGCGLHAVHGADRALAGTRPRHPLGVGRRCGTQGSPAVGPVDTPARDVGAHEREPGDGAGDN